MNGTKYYIAVSAMNTIGAEIAKSAEIAVTPIRAGDYDNNGPVTIAEVQSAIDMFLGLKTVAGYVDTNSDNNVSISEVQKAINGFLGL